MPTCPIPECPACTGAELLPPSGERPWAVVCGVGARIAAGVLGGGA